MYLCSVCEREASSMARDMQEICPVVGKDGILWARWKAASPWRFGCELHQPIKTTFRLTDKQSAACLRQIKKNYKLTDDGWVKRNWLSRFFANLT